MFAAQSMYKLNNSEEGTGSDPTKSPVRRGQPSPIGSDIMSPHQVRKQTATNQLLKADQVTNGLHRTK